MDGRPVAGLRIMALPFDPDRLLDSLASEAPTPRPDFSDLETELRQFQRVADSVAARSSIPWRALRDTVVRLSDSLNAVDRRSPGYPSAYERFRDLYQRLLQQMAANEGAARGVDGATLSLARRAQRAADSLRAWEDEAYAGYSDAALAAIARAGGAPLDVVTDSAGIARLVLSRGRWWLVARLADAENPFMEYYWRVRMTTTGWLPVGLPLDHRTALWRWRH
jgi:hypothetical protein